MLSSLTRHRRSVTLKVVVGFVVLLLCASAWVYSQEQVVTVPVTSVSNPSFEMSSRRKQEAKKRRDPLIVEGNAPITASLIFMHGLGDSGFGWQPAAREFVKHIPYLRVILPHAPNMPVTLNYGMKMPAWHDIKDLDSLNPDDLKGMDANVEYIQSLIEAESQTLGGSDRVVVGGFSQGAAMSAFVGLQHSSSLAGIICCSGYPAFADVQKHVNEAQTKTPVLVAHGDADNVVALKHGKLLASMIKKVSVPVQMEVYPRLGHSFAPKEMVDVVKFLQKAVPEKSPSEVKGGSK